MRHLLLCSAATVRIHLARPYRVHTSKTFHGTPALFKRNKMDQHPDYTSWSHADLIQRVTALEARLASQNAAFTPSSSTPSPSSPPKFQKKPKKAPSAFDPSKYSTRLIALKFAYLGGRYNGYEHHVNNTTPLPTIEEELWKALRKTRLIFPTGREGEVDWEGCEYSKCGRTDRGVSAFGQVVGVRVRSNRPLDKRKVAEGDKISAGLNASVGAEDGVHTSDINGLEVEAGPGPRFDPIKDELPYIQLLNRVLPPDIRILAWCPNPPPDFSARFNCKERRYQYFFTTPAYAPSPGNEGVRAEDRKSHLHCSSANDVKDGWLDIDAMREAAAQLEGLHDFRNFCKVDPSKQITNFQRRIFHATVRAVLPEDAPASFIGGTEFQRFTKKGAESSPTSHGSVHDTPQLYCFDVHGSAFLWHQVRHLVAVLFLVGQGLESPSIVSDLLDVEKNPTKPKYEMASDTPLILWDCVFPTEGAEPSQAVHARGSSSADDSKVLGHQDSLEWIYVGDEGGNAGSKRAGFYSGSGKYGRNGIIEDVWSLWRQRKMDEMLAGSLLDVIARQGRVPAPDNGSAPTDELSKSARVFDGGDTPRSVGKYIPVMQRERMEAVEIVNARYAARKGLSARASAGAVNVDE